MRYSTQVKPVSYVKTHIAEILAELGEAGRDPFIITQNGEAKAVLQGIRDYEQTQETLALLQILLLGEQEIAEGKAIPAADAFKRIRRSRKAA